MRAALGYGAPHFPLADHYAKEGEEWMYGRGSHDRLTDSGDWRERIVLTEHRYMLEDTANRPVVPRFGRRARRRRNAAGAGLCSPSAARSAARISWRRGRTLKSLGFGHLDRAGLQSLLRDGFR